MTLRGGAGRHHAVGQNRRTASRAYLIASACLAGGLVSAGLAAAELAESASRNRVGSLVGSLVILGCVMGALAGCTAMVNIEKLPGRAGRINAVALRLAGIGLFSPLIFFLAQHGLNPHDG